MSGAVLSANPESVDFGEVTELTSADVEVVLLNTATNGSELEILSISLTTGAEFSLQSLPTLPYTLATGASVTFVVRAEPGSAAAFTDTVVVEGDFFNNPVNIPVSVTGIAAGTRSLTVDPTEWTFPNTKAGTSSSEKVFTIRNTGSVTVQVTALTFSAEFAIGGTSPALPANILAGATLDFGGIFSPAAAGQVNGTVSVVSNAAATPFVVALGGIGFLITPVYMVTGGVVEMLLSFFVPSIAEVRVEQFENPISFASESDTIIKKLHNFNGLGTDKTLAQFYFHYQDFGEVELVVTVRNYTDDSVGQSQTLNIGTVGADLKRKLALAEFVIEGEDIELEIIVLAGDGPLFIEDYIFKFMPWTEQLGTVANPTSITSAYEVDPDEVPLLLAAFDDDISVGYLDPEDFESETAAIAGNSILLPFPTETGAIPGFTYEKTVMRVFVHYEYLGAATLRVNGISMRGQVSTQVVTLVAPPADEVGVQVAVVDLIIKDEIQRIEFVPVSGPMSLVDYTVKYEVGGERAK